MTGESRSAAFWQQVNEAKTLNAGETELLVQACRLIDRLDVFAEMLEGDRSAWFKIEWPYEDAPAAVVVTSVVSEARQHVAELRQVIQRLNIPSAKADAGRPSKVDELLAKRKAKGA